MIENKERLQKCKDLVRFFLGQANSNLEQAKIQCLFIHPDWQTIEVKIRESISLINKILETAEKSNGDENYPRF
jgi:hypothetical protein